MKKFLSLAAISIFLFSCSSPVDIEGDIFLIKGDGTPQPAAAKDVFFIKVPDSELSNATALHYLLEREFKLEAEKIELSQSERGSICANILPLALEDTKEFKKSFNFKSFPSNKVNQYPSCSEYVEDWDRGIKFTSSKETERIKNEIKKIETENENLGREYFEEVISKLQLSYNRGAKLTNNSDETVLIPSSGPTYRYVSKHGTIWGRNSIASPLEFETSRIRSRYKQMDDYGREYSRIAFFFKPGETISFIDFIDRPTLSRSNDAMVKEIFKDLQAGVCGEAGYDYDTNIYTIFNPKPGILGTSIKGCATIDMSKIKWSKSRWSDDFFKITDFPPKWSEETNDYETKTYTDAELGIRLNPQATKEIENLNKELVEAQTDFALEEGTKKACDNYLAELEQKESLNDTLKNCELLGLKSSYDLIEAFDLNPDDREALKVLKRGVAVEAAANFSKELLDSPKTKTGISGSYELKQLPQGQYLAVSEYKDNFNDGVYLKLIDVNENGQRIDLTNSDFYIIDFGTMVTDFYILCDDKGCPNTNWLNTAVELYKKKQKELEEFEDQLEELERLLKDLNL